MNSRTLMLSIVGTATVFSISFFMVKKQGAFKAFPQTHSASTLTDAIRNEINAIGSIIANSYATLDYIDEALDTVPNTCDKPQTVIDTIDKEISTISDQLYDGEFSISNRLAVLMKQINALDTDDETKIAFKETVQDFTEQQEQLISYLNDARKKLASLVNQS